MNESGGHENQAAGILVLQQPLLAQMINYSTLVCLHFAFAHSASPQCIITCWSDRESGFLTFCVDTAGRQMCRAGRECTGPVNERLGLVSKYAGQMKRCEEGGL